MHTPRVAHPARPLALMPILLIAACLPAPHAHQTLKPVTIDPARVPIQYGFGGATRDSFAISDTDWLDIDAMFANAHTPESERHAITRAIARIEQIAGSQTPTCNDRGLNRRGTSNLGKMDCIDESTNTTNYLALFRDHALLQHHDLLNPVWRSPKLIDRHRTAVIRDRETDQRYAVDSWFKDNGEPPMILPLEPWHRGLSTPKTADAGAD